MGCACGCLLMGKEWPSLVYWGAVCDWGDARGLPASLGLKGWLVESLDKKEAIAPGCGRMLCVFFVACGGLYVGLVVSPPLFVDGECVG